MATNETKIYSIDGSPVTEEEFSVRTGDIPADSWKTIFGTWQTHRVAQVAGPDGQVHTFRTSISWRI